MPVFNDARYLPAAIESILRQTWSDLELIISDNASTDETETIARHYAATDPRVSYYRQAENIGAPANWNFVARRARGEFFKWAPGNDYCAPEFLATCLRALDRDPTLVMAYSRTCLVDENDGKIGIVDTDTCPASPHPSQRFSTVLLGIDCNNEQSGLIRRAALLRTGLDRSYPSGDLVLMAELALYGGFHQAKEVLLFRRWGQAAFSTNRSALDLEQLHRPTATRPARFRVWRKVIDAATTALRSPIPMGERARCLYTVARSARWAARQLLAEALGAPSERVGEQPLPRLIPWPPEGR